MFGLPPKLDLDVQALEKQFYRYSRKLHPDVHARASQQEQEWSLAQASLLNDAYRTLKNPLDRTKYLLRLEGVQFEEDRGANPSKVPADLLEEVFELNMQLEELRQNQKMGEDDPQLRHDLEAAKNQFAAQLSTLDEQVRSRWSAWDAAWEQNDEAGENRGERSDDCVVATPQLPAEPGARRGPDPGRVLRVMADERIVGIDLGTTNSLVAFMQGEKPVVIPGEDGLNLVPSVVALGPARDGARPTMLVGNGARQHAIGRAGAGDLLGKAPHGPRRGRRCRGIEVLSLSPGRRYPAGRSVAHSPRGCGVHAAGDFRAHPAPAQAKRGALFWRAGDPGSDHGAGIL